MLKLDRLFIAKRIKLVFKTEQPKRALLSEKLSGKVKPKINTLSILSPSRTEQIRLSFVAVKNFHEKFLIKKKGGDEVEDFDNKRSLMYYKEFEHWEKKNKKTFLETLRIYKQNVRNRASHVDFIKAALKHMKEYGVHRDLECYKNLLDILPKGVYICSNKHLAAGMYFPRQQYAALSILDEMAHYGVPPDAEMGCIMQNIFGKLSYPFKVYKDLLYWTVKWKNKSPFCLPSKVPSDSLQLAKLAVERMTSVDPQTQVSVFQTQSVQDSIDDTWIVSGQSPKQIKLLEKHPKGIPVIVEGGEIIHIRDKTVSYFILRADGEPLPFTPSEDNDDLSDLKSKYFNPKFLLKKEMKTVHEQDDGIIYAICATGTSSKDSLLSWIRILEKTGNHVLSDLPVLFRLKQEEKLPSVTSEELTVTNDNK